MKDWNKIEEVDRLAREKAVSWELVFQESCDTYYFCIDSCVRGENWIGKSYTFDLAVECVLEHLNKI
jgi:hypothetical protein